MEQATNQFNKGLLMDTHPMVQGNDTLTDCLNGTLITMNGNEVILLNDMGNRRVDNAFLPPGYLPVGMKEYGGIIYIAAYNPITNKSQIGSFPSPERKIDSIEYDDTPTALFDFDSFFDSNNNVELDRELGISVLKSDSFMVPISNNVNIHSGDKFVVYSSNLSKLKSNLTNYNNILKYTSLYSANSSGGSLEDYREMTYSPKNRKYTLLLGILNSLNEFVDITKTLCRWEKVSGKWSPKEYNSKESDLSIFNDGYFIPDDFSDPLSGGTIDDKTLIKERLKIPANTYSYKLVGPIYLKASLNHISLFNYNLYGVIDENNDTLITIEGVIVYNCLDGVRSKNKTIPDSVNYFNFEEGTPNENFGFDFMEIKKVNEVEELIFPDLKGQEIGESVYDEATNTYKVKITKTYNIGNYRTSGLFSYVIGVKALYDKEKIYLRGCSVRGLLDLSLLGSGGIKLKKWQFSNGENSSTISYRFDYYKKVDESISNLRAVFTNIKDSSNSIELSLDNFSGTITIKWNDKPFIEKSLYSVKFIYDTINDKTRDIVERDIEYKEEKEEIKRWFLTTSLFNEFYNNISIPDFCSFEGVPINTINAFKEKMEIPFTFSFIPEWAGNSEFDYSSKINGGLLSTTKLILFYGENTIKRHLTIINESIKLKLDNYPSFITLGSIEYSINHPKIKINDILYLCSVGNGVGKTSINLEGKIEIKRGSECDLSEDIIFEANNNFSPHISTESKINQTIGRKQIQLTIQNNYFYSGYNDNYVSSIDNAFLPFYEMFAKAIPDEGYYGKVFPESEDHSGVEWLDFTPDDDHWLYVITKANNAISGGTKYEAASNRDNDSVTFNLKNHFNKVVDLFNNGSKPNQMFMYSFYTYPGLEFYLHDYDGTIRSQSEYARVWWRTNNNEWALVPYLFKKDWEENNKSAERMSFINLFGKGDYVYCMYNTFDWSNTYFDYNRIYAAKNDYLYTNSYSIPLYIVIEFNLKNSENVFDTNSNTYGNLQFTIKNLSKIKKEFLVTTLTVPKEDFIDRIKNFDYNHISNVYIPTAELLDSHKNILNPNLIYKFYGVEKKLVPLSDEPLFVVRKTNSGNILVIHTDNIIENDDIKDWEHSPKTYVDYEGTNRVLRSR